MSSFQSQCITVVKVVSTESKGPVPLVKRETNSPLELVTIDPESLPLENVLKY